jgi:hydroxypyruvate isomerase
MTNKTENKTMMDRRGFIQKAGLTAGAMATGTPSFAGTGRQDHQQFNLKYAPHLGMFAETAGKDPVAQLHFMADQGFTAFEDNGMKNKPVELQKAMAKAMESRGMEMGVFVAHSIAWNDANLASGDEEKRQAFLKEIEESVEVAKRVNATCMTVVPGLVDLRQDMGYQTANVIETLKQASAILEPHGLVMVLEPLNFYNHPGLFLSKAAQGYQICKAVDSPACKILFDIYHQQIQEGNLLPNIEKCWGEIAYFQIGDNPGRNEPTTGEINYKNIFQYIHSRGFEGILGMEHGNSMPGKEGEQAVIDVYRSVDVVVEEKD